MDFIRDPSIVSSHRFFFNGRWRNLHMGSNGKLYNLSRLKTMFRSENFFLLMMPSSLPGLRDVCSRHQHEYHSCSKTEEPTIILDNTPLVVE